MKRSRKDVQGKASKTLNVQFDEQPLTLFSGLIVFQRLFIHLALKEKLPTLLSPPDRKSHLQTSSRRPLAHRSPTSRLS